ncbi:MAG: S8 family serine peptidase [Alphaproteobacteria bacterium]|nr:S8 family serine peptidase [Alphaproteobacteria bacterium]
MQNINYMMVTIFTIFLLTACSSSSYKVIVTATGPLSGGGNQQLLDDDIIDDDIIDGNIIDDGGDDKNAPDNNTPDNNAPDNNDNSDNNTPDNNDNNIPDNHIADYDACGADQNFANYDDVTSDEYTKIGTLNQICASVAYSNLYEDNNNQIATGKGQIISVLSTAFALNHIEFGANLESFTNTGYNAFTNTSALENGDILCDDDCNANGITQGTAVVGVIGARKGDIAGDDSNNNMHGIAYEAKIKPIVTISNDGERIDEAGRIKAIAQASGNDIVAMSYGASTFGILCVPYQGNSKYVFHPLGSKILPPDCDNVALQHTLSEAESDAWLAAINAGTIIVTGSGDNGLNSETGMVVLYDNPTDILLGQNAQAVAASELFGEENANIAGYEASYPLLNPKLTKGWLNVVAVDANNTILTSSNACSYTQHYCLAAPGVAYAPSGTNGDTSQWAMSEGTDIAAAHVSASLALLKQAFPTMAPEEMTQLLLDTATDLGDAGMDAVYGHGMINLQAAFQPQGELEAVALNSNSLADDGVTLQDSALNLASHFGDGAENIKIGVRDDYNRVFVAATNQTVIAPVTVGIATHMKQFDEQKIETHRFNDNTKLAYSNQNADNWMNLTYQLGGQSMVKASFNESYTATNDSDNAKNLRALNIRKSAENVGQMALQHQLNDTLTSSIYAAYGAYDNGYEFSELGNDIRYQTADYTIAIGFGQLREYNQFLGANGMGAYALAKPAISNFTDLSLSHKLGTDGKFNLYGNYTDYKTDVEMRYSDFVNIKNLQANQYAIGMKGSDIFNADDALDIRVATKLAITDGILQQNTVLGYKDGGYNNVQQNYDLSVSERNQQLSLRYQGKFADNSERKAAMFSDKRFFATVNIDKNLHNHAGISQTEIIMGINVGF